MLGTGESPSSSRESITPSTISSSCTVGMNWFQFASPISLIWDSDSRVMRIWKLSKAGPRASTSISRSAASGPNRSATYALSSSSVLMLSSRRIFCQSLIACCSALPCGEACGEYDPVICRSVEIAHAGGFVVAAARVEPPGPLVVGTRRRFHDEETRSPVEEFRFHRAHERGPDAASLRGRGHGEPVEIVRAVGGGRGAEAHVAGQPVARLLERTE